MPTVQQLRVAALVRTNRLLTARRRPLASVLTVTAVALVPIGTFGPLDWVWVVSLVLAAAAAMIAGTPTTALRDIGLLSMFAGWTTVTLLWSAHPGDGIAMIVPIGTALAVYLAIRRLGDAQVLTTLRLVAMVWIVVLIGAMAYTWVFDGSFNTIENDTPIRHAAMALAGLIALVMSTRRHPTLGIALSLGALAAAIVTGSRMASAVIFGIVAVNLITTRRRGPLLLVLGSVLAAVTICFIPSLTEPASEFVADVVDRGLDGSSRPDVWASVLDSCGISLFGSGAGTANTVAGSAHNGFPDPHNEFIRFACDTGLVGSILLWSFLGVAIWHTVKLLRARPNNQIALSALLALASVLLFSVVWNPITAAEFMVPVMVLVALSDGTAERVRRSDHQTSPNSYSAEV